MPSDFESPSTLNSIMRTSRNKGTERSGGHDVANFKNASHAVDRVGLGCECLSISDAIIQSINIIF